MCWEAGEKQAKEVSGPGGLGVSSSPDQPWREPHLKPRVWIRRAGIKNEPKELEMAGEGTGWRGLHACGVILWCSFVFRGAERIWPLQSLLSPKSPESPPNQQRLKVTAGHSGCWGTGTGCGVTQKGQVENPCSPLVWCF